MYHDEYRNCWTPPCVYLTLLGVQLILKEFVVDSRGPRTENGRDSRYRSPGFIAGGDSC
jgi:hypothetical protein